MSTASIHRHSSSGLAIDFSTNSLSSTISVSGSPTHSSVLSSSPQPSVCSGGLKRGTASTSESTDYTGYGTETAYSGTPSLLTNRGTPSQISMELKQILGNANSRLKSGAELSSSSFLQPDQAQNISLEQARSRSRVSLDIFLQSNVCVQGGYLRGHIQIRIRKSLKKQNAMLISGGKLRLIGFESREADREHFVFYQCCAPLIDITLGMERIYSSEPDEHGFSCAAEGTHTLPFVMELTPESEFGTPKGVLSLQSGVSVRYIALVSLLIKDSSSGRQSIAHFYRDCNVWPRLDPRTTLAPTSRPIQVTASDSLRMGGNGHITVTSSLHRLHWVSGQSCFVRVKIINDSEKALKNLSLQLMRSTTVFRTGYKFDASMTDSNSAIADVLQSSTTNKQVAQSVLEVCARGTRGHASAKGWWAGAIPGQTRSFSHCIAIPPDALSISRGHLVEVSYTLQVVVNVATVLPTSVKVSLPLEIINFLSLDPPHPGVISNPTGTDVHLESSESRSSYLTSPMESEHVEHDLDPEEEPDSGDEDLDHNIHDTPHADIEPDDSRSPPRFADLYYSSLQENLDEAAHDQEHKSQNGTVPSESHLGNLQSMLAARVKEKHLERQGLLASTASGDAQQKDRLNAKRDQDPDSGYHSELSAQSTTSVKVTSTIARAEHDQNISSSHNDPIENSALTTQMDRSIEEDRGSSPSLVEPTHSRSPISGVALPNEYIQRPYWKTSSTLAHTDDTSMSPSKALPRIPKFPSEAPEHTADVRDRSNATLTMGKVSSPIKPSSPSAPRAGSVKDKIRELEELASKTDVYP